MVLNGENTKKQAIIFYKGGGLYCLELQRGQVSYMKIEETHIRKKEDRVCLRNKPKRKVIE